MAERDPIIVIHTFHNPMEAHIVKSKLDAYGVPCFLSEENLTLLTTPFLSGGIRLHIFERDRDEAVRVLLRSSETSAPEDDLARCPSCDSRRIISFRDDRVDPSLVVKLILQLKSAHYCMDCETEFD